MLDELAAGIHKTAVEKGFWDEKSSYELMATKLCLIHSEVTETLEALRKNKSERDAVEEIADIVIRTLDFYQGVIEHGYVSSDISLDDVLQYKLEVNKNRPHKHGHNF